MMKSFLSLLLSFAVLSGPLLAASERDRLLPLPVLTPRLSVSALKIPVQSQKLEPSKKSWDFAAKQVRKMSVDEKVGQLVHVGINARFANQDSAFFKDLRRHVVENKIGGIIFFGAPIYETTHIANRMQEAASIPLLMSLDAETGIGMRFEDATNFPWAMAVTATGDPEYARRMGVITGREARAIGIQHVYAPVLDVNNNADNPVINVRSFGEDPDDVARFGVRVCPRHSEPKSNRDRQTFSRPRRHQCRFAPRPSDHRTARVLVLIRSNSHLSKKLSTTASARS